MERETREFKFFAATETDPTLHKEMEQVGGGRSALACYQCAKCTSGCPVAALDPAYNPRQILRMAQMGLRERVMESSQLWLCLLCFTCQERCPQDVRPAEVISGLKNLAFQAGHVPPGLVQGVRLVLEDGRIYPVDEFQNEYREDLGLPALDEETGLLEEIFEVTGLSERLGR